MQKLFVAGAAFALASAATSAHAAIVVQGFNIAPGGWFGGGNPYGVGPNPTFNGTITVDTNDTSGTTFQAINYVTGSRVWTLADIDIANSSVAFVGNAVQLFSLVFTDAGNYVYSSNTAALNTGGQFLACNDCVSLTNAQAVPEPATWAMMIAGFGLAGSALRRRASRVVFAV